MWDDPWRVLRCCPAWLRLAIAAFHRQSRLAQRGNFLQQGKGIEHDAVADDGLASGAQNAAGNQLQDEFLAVDGDGVPGVMASGVARHHGEMFGKDIDNLAFAFVSPLRAHDDGRLRSVQNASFMV